MIRNGVFLPPSQFEAWFLSSALTKEDLVIIEKAVDKAVEAVANSLNKMSFSRKWESIKKTDSASSAE